MNYQFVRFFTINGKMEWDSIKDIADLRARSLRGRDANERSEIEAALLPGHTLTHPGGFVKLQYEVFVRVAS